MPTILINVFLLRFLLSNSSVWHKMNLGNFLLTSWKGDRKLILQKSQGLGSKTKKKLVYYHKQSLSVVPLGLGSWGSHFGRAEFLSLQHFIFVSSCWPSVSGGSNMPTTATFFQQIEVKCRSNLPFIGERTSTKKWKHYFWDSCKAYFCV